MLPEQFKALKLISDCPVCQKKQFPAEVKLLEEYREGHLLHVQCKYCKSCVVVFVRMEDQGLNLIGVLTDLQSDEIMKFHRRGPISSDDVLEVHDSIKNNNFIKQII
jgi:hypothetical protein